MAFHRYEAKVMSRSRGHNAVDAAAYRSGSLLHDSEHRESFDYRHRRRDIAYSAVLLPDGAPAWARDRSRLWSAVERAESSPRAQLAREVLLSLPHELGVQAAAQTAREFLEERFVARGQVVDMNVHLPDPGADQRNIHAHVMMTLRELQPTGFGAKVPGWMPRFARAPGGRGFVADTSQLMAEREAWAVALNVALERAGFDVRVDHRPLRDRGIDREPEPKLGQFATAQERRGIRTRAGDALRAVQARNRARERGDEIWLGRDVLQVSRVSPRDALRIWAAGFDSRESDRARLLDESYGSEMAKALGKGWAVERVAAGLRLLRGSDVVEDRGESLYASTGSESEIRGILTAARLKGWTELTIDPRAAEDQKRLFIRMALDAGFAIAASGRDEAIVRSVQADRRGPETAEDRQQAAARVAAAGGVPTSEVEIERDDVGDDVPKSSELDRDVKVVRIMEDVVADRPMFTKRLLERVAAKYAVDVDDRAQLVKEVLGHPGVRRVAETARGDEVYTTELVRNEEQRLLEDIEVLREQHNVRFKAGVLDRLIAEARAAKKLSDQQEGVLRGIGGAPGWDAVSGIAGGGKSTLLKIFCEALRESGYVPIGTAISAKAVRNLKGLGIDAITIAKALHRWSDREDGRGPSQPLTSRHVVLRDEAGMIGTPDYARMTRLIVEAGASVRDIGDIGQLQPVQGGGAFAMLISRFGAHKITEVWRQKLDLEVSDPEWMRKATQLFYEGKAVDGLGLYDAHGYMHEFATRDEARAALIEQWSRDRAAHPDLGQLILASTHADIRDLNLRAQEERRRGGELGEEIVVRTPAGKKLPAGEKRFAVGDAVYFLENDEKGIGVDNGSMGVVTAVDGTKMRVEIRDEPKPRTVTVDLMKYPDVQLGYAVVIHKSQGSSIPLVYQMASSFLNSELTYVGMTRHQEAAQFYWSRDVFSNRSQLDRVVGRSDAKGVSLDAERDIAAAQAGHYSRTLHHLSRDVQGVLDLARELYRVAPAEMRAAAGRGLAKTRDWVLAREFELEQLRSAKVPTVAIAIHPERFNAKMAAIEAGLGKAVTLMKEQEATRHVESPAREIDPGLTPAEPSVDVANAPSVTTAVTPVQLEKDPGRIEIRSIRSDALVVAERLLDSSSYLEATAALMLATGRQSPEVLLRTAELQRGMDDRTLLFSGQARSVSEERRTTQYEIPTLISAEKCLETWERVRQAKAEFAQWNAVQLNSHIGKALNQAVKRTFGDGVRPMDLRAMYATLAYDQARFPDEDRLQFATRALMLSRFSIDSVRTYSRWAPEGREAATVREYEVAARSLDAELRGHLEAARSARNDAEVGYTEAKLLALGGTTWFAPVRDRVETLSRPEDAIALLSEALANAQRGVEQAQAERAALGDLVAPLHPDVRIAAELDRLRANYRTKAAWSASELQQVRDLEARRGDPSAERDVAALREAKNRDRAQLGAELRAAERALAEPLTRKTLDAEYARSLKMYRTQAEAVERVEAMERVSAADVRRYEAAIAGTTALARAGTFPPIEISGTAGDRAAAIAEAVERVGQDLQRSA